MYGGKLDFKQGSKGFFAFTGRGLVCIACLAGLALSGHAVIPVIALQGTQTVTLDAQGWSLASICEAISAQVGQNVTAHGDCVTDHIIVKVHNVPWSVLQQKLAWAEYGHWVNINNVLTLERDPKQVQARIQQTIDDLAARIADQFKDDKATTPLFNANQFVKQFSEKEKVIREDYESDPDPDDPPLTAEQLLQATLHQMSGDVPFDDHFRRIIETFGPRVLANVPIGSRIVYSNHPTSLQLAMPESTMKAIQTVVDENNQLLRAFNAKGINLGGDGQAVELTSVGPDCTFVIAFRNSAEPGIHGSLRVFDPSGNLIIDTFDTFGDTDPPDESDAEKRGVTQYTLSPEAALEFEQLNNADIKPLPDALIQKLRHPLQTDPLALLVSPILEAFAPHKNIVVSNDSLLADAMELEHSKVPSNYFAKEPTDVDSSDNWLTLRTNYPDESPDQTLLRQSYDRFVQTISPYGQFDFVASMRFAASLGPNGNDIAYNVSDIMNVFGPGKNPLAVRSQDWDMFQLVGSLDDSQLAQAESKQGLPIAGLAANAREALKATLLYEFNYRSADDGSDQQKGTDADSTLQGEPTIAFAQSLHGGVLSITLDNTPLVTFLETDEDSSQPARIIDAPSGLAALIDGTGDDGSPKAKFSQFSFSQDFTYTITISFPGTTFPPVVAHFETLGYGPKTYRSFKDFPASLIKEIESEAAQDKNDDSGDSSITLGPLAVHNE